MTDREPSLTDFVERLQQLRLPSGLSRTSADVQQELLDLALARIASLTEALRAEGSTDVARITARLLLADLALVAAQFRGDANVMSAALTRAADGLRAALAQTEGA